ncbi:MAG: prepilin-type N-terminal cleavage/methylation domain-containing protein [Alphaproteobacteria bacterium]|nr:prepilin-type N-terminal cleavage/methylation domain-containing protein [Alphaproteobacteria bacterium]
MRRTGFTLLEISIVLVVVGLIVGGVLAGRSLIQASEIRSQISHIRSYNLAVNTFRLKYNCIPGDCPNASDFFGTAWRANLHPYVSATGSGDGDSNIWGWWQDVNGFPSAPFGEPMQVIYHLYLSGLTDCCNPSNFSGWHVSTPYAGLVFPTLKIGNGGFIAMNLNNQNGWWMGVGSLTPAAVCCGGNLGDYANFTIGSPSGQFRLTPDQALSFDAKVDDGLPTTGNVFMARRTGGDGLIHPEAYHASYNCITAQNGYNTGYTLPSYSPFVKWQ